MREEKKLLLEEIKEKVENAKSLIVTKYENITPYESWTLRQSLAKTSSEMEMVKKRIFLRALQECGYKYKLEDLEGQIAVIFIKGEAVEAAKALCDFAESTNKLELLRGEIEKQTYQKDDLIMLSKLPTMIELRAQFLGLLEAPMTQTVSVINSLLTSVIYALEEKKKLEEKK